VVLEVREAVPAGYRGLNKRMGQQILGEERQFSRGIVVSTKEWGSRFLGRRGSSPGVSWSQQKNGAAGLGLDHEHDHDHAHARDHEDEARTRDHEGGALVLGEERSSLGEGLGLRI
jgi:hypothetical protein